MKDLIKLLSDLVTKYVDKEDLNKIFDEIAICLLRQAKIVTPIHQFYFREIEIYYYNKDIHPDTYAHKHLRQLEFGEWYFHRYTNIESFLKSNRNGIDITFGNKSQDIYGGILIRKIQNIESGNLTVGINKVVRALIDGIGDEKVNYIAKNTGQTAFDKNQLLHLEVEENNYAAPIYKTQRNGLTLNNQENANHYYKAAYCYFNYTRIIEVRSAG